LPLKNKKQFFHYSNVKNPLIVTHCPHGYVLKILNSLDSKKQDFVDGQNQLLLYLGNSCPLTLS